MESQPLTAASLTTIRRLRHYLDRVQRGQHLSAEEARQLYELTAMVAGEHPGTTPPALNLWGSPGIAKAAPCST